MLYDRHIEKERGCENMKYTVTGHATVVCSMVVEANKVMTIKADEKLAKLAEKDKTRRYRMRELKPLKKEEF